MYLFVILNFLIVSTCLGAGVKPWEPHSKTGFWLKKHESILKTTEELKNETKVVFIGASITEFWQNEGKSIWKSYYVNRSAVNYGIGGDTTSNVLWRIKNHELDGLTPKVIVLQIGFNNFGAYNPAATNGDIAKGVNEVAKQLSAKCPESKVINIGLLPVKDQKLNARVKLINEIIEKNADNKHVFFLDLRPDMEDSAGHQKTGVFKEGVHLTAHGYEIWHKYMNPMFEKLYNNKD